MSGQELMVCNTVVSLPHAQCSTAISNDMRETILNLRQYCSYCVQDSASVWDEFTLVNWVGHDIQTSKCFL